jgi:osmotically-inducible protein OsmY
MAHPRIVEGLLVVQLALGLGGCKNGDHHEAALIPSAPRPLNPGPPRELSDAEVAAAVRASLDHDPGFDASHMQVRSTHGIVELSGSAGDLLAKGRAVRVAEAVKGVRSVEDRIELRPETRTDAQMKSDLEEALRADAMTEAYEIEPEVATGKVTLNGKVHSWLARQIAERVAEGVRGVREVKNDLSVEHRWARTDAQVAADVQSCLRWDALVNDGLIGVRVNGGRVSLTGEVASAVEKRRAVLDAWVPGANQVLADGLEVTWWAPEHELTKNKLLGRSDADITKALRTAVSNDPRVNAAQLHIDVSSGVATLTGRVATPTARMIAEELARHTVGVVSASNELTIEPGKSIRDADLKRSIQRALRRGPSMHGHRIAVRVKDGKVALDGSVEDAFARAQATTIVSSIRGVTDVDNYLKTKHPERLYIYNSYLFPYAPYCYRWRYIPTKAARSDAEIAQDIHRELVWSPFVDAEDIKVSVSYGRATLTGEVSTHFERKAVIENAFEGGATSVDNLLAIGKGG